jgi:hypothetical protein
MQTNAITSLARKLLLGLIILCLGTTLHAQEDKDMSFTVTLNSDQFFGFYPFFQGGYGLSDKVDFTFYGILWSGGTGGAWGNWTEFGVGVSLMPTEGLSITPQVGILGGNLLSSGAAGAGVLGDGFVPNLTVGLDRAGVQGELYAGFYIPTRDESTTDGTTLSYVHYWANLGYQFSDLFSTGVHFEHLINSGGSNVAEATDAYQWIGPYVQFDAAGGFARFSAGGDLLEGADSFYKLTVGFGL